VSPRRHHSGQAAARSRPPPSHERAGRLRHARRHQRPVDEGSLLEIKPLFARELIVGFARLEGGLSASWPTTPSRRAGSSSSTRRQGGPFHLVLRRLQRRWCSSADVPGFMVGTQVERQGIIRHGAKMITAWPSDGPRCAWSWQGLRRGPLRHVRPAFEPDACLALPSAQIAVMGPEAAVKPLREPHRGFRGPGRTGESWPSGAPSTRGCRPCCGSRRTCVATPCQPEDLRSELVRAWPGRRRAGVSRSGATGCRRLRPE